MAYSALSPAIVGEMFEEADYNQLADNMAAGLPGLFTAQGQIAAGTGSQAIGVVAPTANGQALVADSGAANGIAWAGGTVRVGMIVIWSGSVGSIPTGWQLCDGSSGTPDLRGQFVVGAGSSYAVDASGGAAVNLQHNHIPTASFVDSGGAAHTHTQGATGTEFAHDHASSGTTGAASATITTSTSSANFMASNVHTHAWSGSTATVVDEALHSHTNATTDSGGAGHIHSIGSMSNALSSYLPTYYALAFIMRTA